MKSWLFASILTSMPLEADPTQIKKWFQFILSSFVCSSAAGSQFHKIYPSYSLFNLTKKKKKSESIFLGGIFGRYFCWTLYKKKMSFFLKIKREISLRNSEKWQQILKILSITREKLIFHFIKHFWWLLLVVGGSVCMVQWLRKWCCWEF